MSSCWRSRARTGGRALQAKRAGGSISFVAFRDHSRVSLSATPRLVDRVCPSAGHSLAGAAGGSGGVQSGRALDVAGGRRETTKCAPGALFAGLRNLARSGSIRLSQVSLSDDEGHALDATSAGTLGDTSRPRLQSSCKTRSLALGQARSARSGLMERPVVFAFAPRDSKLSRISRYLVSGTPTVITQDPCIFAVGVLLTLV